MLDASVTPPEKSSPAEPRRRRGRPVDRTNRGKLQRLEIWLHIETILARYAAKYHRPIPISTLAGWIEKYGGIGSAIGGDVDAVAEAVDRKRGGKQLKATRRDRKRYADGVVTIVDHPTGQVFVKDLSRARQSIRVRYYEARRILKSDPRLCLRYENLLAERLGRPPPHATPAIAVPLGNR